ncbi:hypothetical protein HBB16_02740 [Pseudonocardia sp. MCCB 268]|nr:hypothetical protein [Pseudonocardia cytotoxica]
MPQAEPRRQRPASSAEQRGDLRVGHVADATPRRARRRRRSLGSGHVPIPGDVAGLSLTGPDRTPRGMTTGGTTLSPCSGPVGGALCGPRMRGRAAPAQCGGEPALPLGGAVRVLAGGAGGDRPGGASSVFVRRQRDDAASRRRGRPGVWAADTVATLQMIDASTVLAQAAVRRSHQS